MYKKILVPLDGSELAEVVVPYAEEFVARMGHEVHILYVSDTVNDLAKHMHQLYLDRMIEIIKSGVKRQSDKDYNFKTAIVTGEPAEGIVQYADKEEVDLIIIATHGRHGVRRWTLGSVAEKVVRATDHPVVLIRTPGATGTVNSIGTLKKILVPLDGSKEGETVIPYAEKIALRFQAEVVLVQVMNSGYFTIAAEGYNYVAHTDDQMESFRKYAMDYLEGAVSKFASSGIHPTTEVKVGNPAEEIISLADIIQADMVAMSTHARSRLGRWVFGSVAERVLFEGHTHLLLVRVPKGNSK